MREEDIIKKLSTVWPAVQNSELVAARIIVGAAALPQRQAANLWQQNARLWLAGLAVGLLVGSVTAPQTTPAVQPANMAQINQLLFGSTSLPGAIL